MEKPLLVLFDGNAIVHRAYHAFQTSKRPTVLTVSKTGEVVTAVYGFASMLLKVINDLKPACYAIAFDTKAPTFRHLMYDQYKAQRPATPDELVDQFGRVRQLVEAFRLPIYELDGYEADDVLGTLSLQASQEGVETIIVTGDADTMQLVSPTVKILYPKPRGTFSDTMVYDEAAVKEKYGIGPHQIADYKALVGDTSDNIPGVRGIGEKTAVKLLQQFGSIEEIYARLDQVTPPRIQAILREGEAIARQSKKLATIDISAPVSLDLKNCQISNFDRARVIELFRELEFFSLLPKLPEASGEAAQAAAKAEAVPLPQQNYRVVDTPADLEELVARLASVKSFAFDTETDSLEAMAANLVGISLSPAPGEAYYIPVGHQGFMGQARQLPVADVLGRLKPLLSDPALAKLAHNANYDMTVLGECGVTVNNLTFDTMLAAHLLSEKSLNLKALAFGRLGIEMTAITELLGTGPKQLNMSQVEIDKAASYASADADMTVRLAESLAVDLHSQGLWQLFDEVEMPLVPVLVGMQRNGIALDTGLLRQMSKELGEQLLKLEAEIYKNVGHQFNINSSQQLGIILFEELHLPAQKRRGAYSTAADVLEELRGVHPIIQSILDYRQFAKLKSTYVDALPNLINRKTGRLHTSFNQTRTATGRLSSSDPNLQNIPVRGETGQKVRQAFIAPPGTLLLSCDYSQIDLRALAHLSQDAGLVEAFKQDEDIHSATASRLFGVERRQVTADMRRVAKTVNFGVIYGMSDYGLEQATELSREEATQFIKAYFEKYPGVKRYLEETKKQARATGYVQTLLGRRRSIADINSSNRQVREAAERMAINMPVQGTSADIIKVAMVKLFKEMAERRSKSKMLLQVHDELLFEVPDNELGEMRKLVPEIMSTAIELSVPIKVDSKSGPNWADMK
ncbi:MAG: DNA polymerase I [Chloroflexi bacterium]|nr:DNA polymerase I [Chloroflexota bacterium]